MIPLTINGDCNDSYLFSIQQSTPARLLHAPIKYIRRRRSVYREDYLWLVMLLDFSSLISSGNDEHRRIDLI
jgi:hypothetical protein